MSEILESVVQLGFGTSGMTSVDWLAVYRVLPEVKNICFSATIATLNAAGHKGRMDSKWALAFVLFTSTCISPELSFGPRKSSSRSMEG